MAINCFRFEVVITLTGSSRLSGQMTQSRTSYLPSDILWGQRFKKVLRSDSLSVSLLHMSWEYMPLLPNSRCSSFFEQLQRPEGSVLGGSQVPEQGDAGGQSAVQRPTPAGADAGGARLPALPLHPLLAPLHPH